MTLALVLFAHFAGSTAAGFQEPANKTLWSFERPQGIVRFVSFNIFELSREKLVVGGGDAGSNPQLQKAAEALQRLRPDVLLVNEIDFDAETRENARFFLRRYLAVPQNGQPALDLPHLCFEPVNTGVPSGRDFS